MIDRAFESGQNDAAAFGDGDRAVLQVIGEEKLLGFTFEGLRRRLSAHSETLSRIIGRLEKEDIVARSDSGYVVTDRGREVAALLRACSYDTGVTILKTILPPVQDSRMVVSGLLGRWFGNLRWFGHSGSGGTTVLKWVTEDGHAQVDAVFEGSSLTINVRAGKGGDISAAIEASHRLVGHISGLYAHRHGRPEEYSIAAVSADDN